MIRGSWIPPVPLAAGAVMGVLSWVLVLAYAAAPSMGLELAWIHTVALGSFTTIALAVLVHVVPGFTDLRWRGEAIARWCAVLLPFAALGFVASFVLMNVGGIAWFGTLCASLAVVYAIVALVTLRQRTADPTDAAIARALGIVMAALAIAAILGAIAAQALRTGNGAGLRLAPVHASVAIIGWLTLLTMGVSTRTFRPILRSVSRWKVLHIVSNAGMTLCAIGAAIGFAMDASWLVTASFVAGLASGLCYAVDGFDRVARATTPHRPAHVFVAASLTWLLVAIVAALFGRYDVAIAVALAGWLGQMINAHLHHLGIRVIATTIAGDDNEARPWELLDMRLGWIGACAAQAAVVALAFGILSGLSTAFAVAGVAGLVFTLAFAANVVHAIGASRALASDTIIRL
ncbi:MAG TPA: hypothetical protein VFN49_08515 [Candidatus Aquilonibacter sp.]|nr:hypothetical protein [Candidatus Aquilonibacter sp.]